MIPLVLASGALPLPPIIGGEDSAPSREAVVHVHAFVDGHAANCAGTAVTPRTVITARHCIVGLGAPFATCTGATFRDASTADLPSIIVSTGADSGSPSAERAVVSVLAPDEPEVCGHDFVVLVLDLALPVTPLPVRLDRRNTAGELVTVAGWGWTDTTPLPDIRQERMHVPILEVADAAKSWVVPDELVFGESICDGDSGGPLLSEDSGALIGVASRNHHDDAQQVLPPGSCEGDSVRNVAESTRVMLDVLLRATAEASEELTPEAAPAGATLEAGAACASDHDCLSGLCVDDVQGSRCSRLCSEERPCGMGDQCTTAQSVGICMSAPADPAMSGADGGCALSRRPATGQSALRALAVLAALALVRRRRAVLAG